MNENEFRVRPVMRYNLTHYTSDDCGASSVSTVGEFASAEQAELVGRAMRDSIEGATLWVFPGREPMPKKCEAREYLVTGKDRLGRHFVISAKSLQEAEYRKREAEIAHGGCFTIQSV